MAEIDEDEPSPSSTPAQRRPENNRASTEPTPTVLLQGWFKDKEGRSEPSWTRPALSSHSRNRSPYSRSHLRSRSSGAALLSAPLMTRAHSMPNPHTPRHFDGANSPGNLSPNLGSYSPLHSPARSRSPYKDNGTGAYHPPPRSPSWSENNSALGGPVGGMGIEAIQEDSELDITPRSQSSLPQPAMLASFSRSSSGRRRPASPLHGLGSTNSPTVSFPASVMDQNVPINMTASSGSNSPSLGPQRYNEAYPSLHHYASNSSFSSIPSTPTSARSRSPSISSLETIEDAPEQETEAEAIERLRIAADAESDSDDNSSTKGSRRSSLESGRGFGFGFGRPGGRAGERKRWSICGGERRADLDLETIWED